MRGAVNLRRAALTAATAAVAVLAGMLPGTPSAASGPGDTVKLAYTCRFTAGTASDSTDASGTSGTSGSSAASDAAVTEDATVTVHQQYPATGSVGARIQPGPLTVEVALDKDAAGAVLPAGTTSATATGSLTARVTQGASAADAVWSGLRAATTPTADGLDLTFTGDATALSVTAPGAVRFDAGRLDLVVYAEADLTAPPSASPTSSPTTTADSGTSSGDTSSSPSGSSSSGTSTGAAAKGLTGTAAGAHAATAVVGGATAACTPKDGQSTLIGEVGVTAGGSGAATPGTPSPSGTGAATPSATATGTSRHGTIAMAAPPHSGVSTCPAPPVGDPDQKILDSITRPPGTRNLPVTPENRQSECAFLTGLSNVGKLHGASVINDLNDHPALTNVTQTGVWIGFQPGGALYSEFDSVAEMALPPSKSTFLTFGFVPTTAEMTLTQVGLLTLVIIGSTGSYVTNTTVYGKLELRLSHITVNGVPLDVGSDCHAVEPLDVKLVGVDMSQLAGVGDGTPKPTDYNEIAGGPLSQDDLYIPPFTGCSAHGDNVDALLTASISGSGNSLNLIQGPLCIPSADLNCHPEIQFPTPPHR
jgi:hypothetical protein